MGQYHHIVNLDKREYLYAHQLGDGLKLMEQAYGGMGGTTSALLVLLACSNGRGGGDAPDGYGYDYTKGEETVEASLHDLAKEVIGRWAGDRIAVVGDYAEDADLAPEHLAGAIYGLCADSPEDFTERVGWYREAGQEERAAQMEKAGPYTNISSKVRAYFERAEGVKYENEGIGWLRRFTP